MILDFYSVICHQDHDMSIGRHYHCVLCDKVVRSKKNIANHMALCVNQLQTRVSIENSILNQQPVPKSPPPSCIDDHAYSLSPDLMQNKHESTTLVRKKNVKKKNESSHYSTVISPAEGIFCVLINKRGPGNPIHVVKRTTGESDACISFCENLSCIDLKDTAVRGQNVAFECAHLQSIATAVPGRKIDLQLASLQDMVENHLLTSARYDELKSWHENIDSESPLIVQIPSHPVHSQRYIYLSVFTGLQRHWSRIGRTIVTVDTNLNTITCKCSKTKRYCLHKAFSFKLHL